jgi:hypothetical protein
MRKPRKFYSSMSLDDWLSYGCLMGYNNMNSQEIKKEDATYYAKGMNEGWIERKKKPAGYFKKMSLCQWLKYGFDNGYDKVTRDYVSRKDNAYYQKGMRSGWLNYVIPKVIRKPNKFFTGMNRDQWLAYGMIKKYNKMIRSKLAVEDHRYYRIGIEKGWISELIPVSLQGSHFKKSNL